MKIRLVPKETPEPPTGDEEACPLCGSAYHELRHCKLRRSMGPVRRRWGYPGWERETPARSGVFDSATSDTSEKGPK